MVSDSEVKAAFEAGKVHGRTRSKLGASANPHLGANARDMKGYRWRGHDQSRLGHAWLAGYIMALAESNDASRLVPINERGKPARKPDEFWPLLW